MVVGGAMMKHLVLPVLLLLGVSVFGQESRGMGVVKLPPGMGDATTLYRESWALVIGVSDYAYWPRLPGVKKDVPRVKEVLEEHGFRVETLMNLSSERLKKAFDDFINAHGQEEQNRLLFYFAGHGHTITNTYGGEMGYIVPVDAPLATKDERGFKAKALDLQLVEVYAKRIQAKHALFLFDSCFSGSLFSATRSVPLPISNKAKLPVRQFITSGAAEEAVSDDSWFCREFVEGLRGEADLDGDGYITGTDLSTFLQDRVITYSRDRQHPQYGKVADPNLDKGDFVFQLAAVRARGGAAAIGAKTVPAQAPPAEQQPGPPAKRGCPREQVAQSPRRPPGRRPPRCRPRRQDARHHRRHRRGRAPHPGELAGYGTEKRALLVTRYKDVYEETIALRAAAITLSASSGIEIVVIPAEASAWATRAENPRSFPFAPSCSARHSGSAITRSPTVSSAT